MDNLPPDEIRFQVEFRIGEIHHDLNRLLLHLELGQIECEINHMVYPVMWPATRAHDPPITDLHQHWVAWDEELSSDMVIHFYIADRALFSAMDTLANHLQNQIGMVSHQIPRTNRSETLLIIHQVPTILLMELFGQMSHQIRNLDNRVRDLEATVQFLRNHLGI